MQLNCCGWDGPKEFAYNNEPIDESCYEKHNDGGGGGSGGDSANAIWASRRSDDGGENALPTKKMKQVIRIRLSGLVRNGIAGKTGMHSGMRRTID